MSRRPLILRREARDATLQSAGAAFWLVLMLALAVGGGRAVSGFPALVDTLIPPGLMAAQAQGDASPKRVDLALRERFPASIYAPQWLTPVAARGFPDWLNARIAYGMGQGGAISQAPQRAPVIAIVIDDLGSDAVNTRRAIALPGAVSLSFLPYGGATPALARDAGRAGHQILVHVPMEPDGADDPGPNALLAGHPTAELLSRLDWALSRVPGFAGINNHEGSRLTADRSALVPIVEALADRHVFFLDSRTSPNSVVVPVSRALGVASAARDVFLDDVQTKEAVEASLAQTEALARRDGVAIAIGHPHAVTMEALAAWCAHRTDLVAVSVAIRLKTEREIEVSR
jgi:polysaccharide deacetylase 2 family uncharacterized protein YibQ